MLPTAVLGFTAGRVTAPTRRAPSPTVPALSSLPPEGVARAATNDANVDDSDADAAQTALASLVREDEARAKRPEIKSEIPCIATVRTTGILVVNPTVAVTTRRRAALC